MDRRLLPYEYQLIEALGVSKEEYLEFVALQQEYKDPKAGSALDVRNEVGTIALVLTVVGILFQVGAALLAPKPNIPDLGANNKRRNRQQRFAPSSGFNSAPELASYGDPANLVYTSINDNPSGGVRVSGSLVWSSVDNYGSSQFIQLLFVLGAAEILNLSTKRTAFGSLSIEQLDPATVFLFYKSGGKGKHPVFNDFSTRGGDLRFYPQDLKRDNNQAVCQVVTITDRGGTAGFSQAYSPTTSSSLGVYDPIPVNVEMVTRDSEGEEQDALNGIELEQLDWTNPSFQYKEGSEILVRFQSKGYRGGISNGQFSANAGETDAVPLAVNLRRQSVNALDFGSTYMLGSAKFRLLSFGGSKDIDNDDVNVRFRCVERGFCPTAPYNEVSPVQEAKNEKKKLMAHLKILRDIVDDEEPVPEETQPVGLRRFDDEGNDLPDSPTIQFRKKEQISKNVKDQYNTTGFANKNFKIGHCTLNYDFEAPLKVMWINELDQKKSYTIDTNGSIKYTKELQSDVSFPTINRDALIKELESDRTKLKRLRRRVRKGEYDDVHTWLYIPNKIGKDGHIKESPFNNGTNQPSASLPMVIFSALEHDRTVGDLTNNSLLKLNEKLDRFQNKFENFRAQINKELKTNPYRSYQIKQTIAGESVWEPAQVRIGQGNAGQRRFVSLDKLTKSNNQGSLQPRQSAQQLSKKISDIQERIVGRVKKLEDEARDWIIEQLEDYPGEHVYDNGTRITDPAFRSTFLNERFGAGGIEQTEERISELGGSKRKTEDPAGRRAIESGFTELIALKENALRRIKGTLEDWDDCIAAADNHFFVKALVKAESAAYETISKIDQVKFSIKSKLFRRISGREKKYGEEPAPKKYSRGDNGIHVRQAFFRFSYKKGSDKSYTVHPVLFSLRQGSESDAYNDFNFLSPSRDRYAFKLEPVYDVDSELRLSGQKKIVVLNSNETSKSTKNAVDSVIVWYKGSEIDIEEKKRQNKPYLIERGPELINEWDVFSVNTDTQIQFSLENGPEMSLTAVTEQQIQSTKGIYNDLSMLGLSMFAGQNVQDLRNVSAFVEEGKTSYTVDDFDSLPTASTSYAPDIFVDTVLDKQNGIGKYAPKSVLDQDSLKLAKRFCRQNNLPGHFEDNETPTSISLFMDCVIADDSSWREFWVSNAPFSLLEFARKNGKETLVPVVPVTGSGRAAEDDGRPISLAISALFTTGNILENSYKEEFLDYGASTQDLIASVVYREEYTETVFQRKRTVQVKRKNTNVNKAIKETFDASSFITSRQQAILFGKMLVNQRKFIRRGVEFKTFPSNNPVEPGAFIYVDIGLTNWERRSSGVIGTDGILNSPLQDKIEDGTYSFLIYDRNDSKVHARDLVAVSGGVASQLSENAQNLYVMGIDPGKKRVFRITEVEMDQDGEVTVRAVEYPCDDEDRAYVADFRSTEFDVS